MIITNDHIAWVKIFYPGLKVNIGQKKTIVEGNFEFRAAFNKKRKGYIINPKENYEPKDSIIHDSYKIRITIENEKNFFREVEETDKRIKTLAGKKGRSLSDLHIYPSNKLCIYGYLEENLNITLVEFLDGPILQFFYDESYYEKYDEWPRDYYSHGICGILENYADLLKRNVFISPQKCLEEIKNIKDISNSNKKDWERFQHYMTGKKKIKNHYLCICGSGYQFYNCDKRHKLAHEGFCQLKKNRRKERLDKLNITQ